LAIKNQRGQIAYAVLKVRPRTHQTSKATTTLYRGVYFFCWIVNFGRFKVQNSAKRYILYLFKFYIPLKLRYKNVYL